MNSGWNEMQMDKTRMMFLAVAAVICAVFGMFSPFFIVATGRTYMNPVLWMFGGIFCAAILLLIFYKIQKRYRRNYKNLVVSKAAADLFDEYSYYPEDGVSQAEIALTGIMRTGNRFQSEDMVTGTYKGVNFRRSDVYIAQHTSTGKSSHTTVYLRGSWLVFQYNKKFESDLQISTKDFMYELKNTSRLFTRSANLRHSIETEDMEFNKMFECNCQKDTEAFYLLTPRVMQMLKLIRAELNAPFMVGFVDNKMHVAINSGKNHIEPPIFKELNPELSVMRTRTELRTICNIIDAFSMDREIFLGDTEW
ncbi:MAG: DUF3137 domain-containing protein [Lachnospiraceae bacterium]|nr:DUF3137 domain-containing protein [Lachnospiraceae bacterium]